MKKCSWMAFLAAALLSGGCKSNQSFLLTPAENTAPTIQGTVVASATPMKQLENLLLSFGSSTAYAIPPFPADCAATYGYGCLGWEIFTLVREYDPAATYTGEDMINSENMYFALNLAGLAYDDLSKSAAALSATKAVPSPFEFGATTLANETYDKGINGLTSVSGFGYQTGEANIALRKVGNETHFLVSIGSGDAASGWTQGRHKLVMQGVYDSAKGDLELNFVQYMQYPTNDGGGMADQVMILRSHIKGNEKTHYFEFQAGGTNDGSGPSHWNWSNIQGAGYSKGAGQHFLIFYRGTNAQGDPNGVPGAGTQGAYYCIAADTTKASFGAGIYQQPAGYADTAIPADCAAYGSTVAAMPRWEITGTTTTTPQSTDYPLTSDSALYTGSGAQHLGLSL